MWISLDPQGPQDPQVGPAGFIYRSILAPVNSPRLQETLNALMSHSCLGIILKSSQHTHASPVWS